jgi:ketosteroid isomerase-like protein
VKKIVPLIAAVFIAMCAMLSLVQPGLTRNTLLVPPSLQEKVVAKEREELEATKSGDLEHFGRLIADDAVFVDPHGTATKAEVLKNVAGFKLIDFTMEDVKFVAVSENSGLVAYTLTEKGVSHGKEFTNRVHASALWAERAGTWLCLFSQETPARTATPQ